MHIMDVGGAVESAHSSGAASTMLDRTLIVKTAEGGCGRGSIEGGERYTHGAKPSSSSASQALQARPGATKEMGGTPGNPGSR
jgi:hypothetical protein